MTASPFQQYVFIGLGANLASIVGSPVDTVLHAITLLAKLSAEPLLISSLLESKPLDCPPGSPLFINAVVGLVPTKHATGLSLLDQLQQIENNIGRTRSGVVNEARVLDLDLITFKNERYQSPRLIVPHPRATQRIFVLQPLRELVGNLVFPGQEMSLDELLARLD